VTTTQDWRCSTYARAEGLDPVGTAGEYDAFFLVAISLPWPREVLETTVLAPLRSVLAANPRARVLAVVPNEHARRDVTVVHRARRAGEQRFDGTDHVVEPAGLRELVQALLLDPAAQLPSAVGASPPDVLVCTHGRRDVCCGAAGTVLHAKVEDRWPGARVWRCSHTGGHRFAPTGIAFPDGRYWGYLDADALDAAVTHTGDLAALGSHYRGLAGLDPWQQAVERELLLRFGWPWAECSLEADTELDGKDRARVRIRFRSPDGEHGVAEATVVVLRRVPTLDCGSPPDASTKTNPELAVTAFEIKVGEASLEA
jgi:hypothetical protein